MKLLKSLFFTLFSEALHVDFCELLASKMSFFKVSFEEREELFGVCFIIRREEALRWKSFAELLDYGFQFAKQSLKGFYGFELIEIQLDEGISNFKAPEFGQLLVNHAKKLEVGQSNLIQYGGLQGRLTKRIQEDWGKIEFKHAVDVYAKKAEQLDLYIKKRVSEVAGYEPHFEGGRNLLVYDLSQDPLFKFGEEMQTERLRKQLEKINKNFSGNRPKIYIFHKGSIVELWQQFLIDEEK